MERHLMMGKMRRTEWLLSTKNISWGFWPSEGDAREPQPVTGCSSFFRSLRIGSLDPAHRGNSPVRNHRLGDLCRSRRKGCRCPILL